MKIQLIAHNGVGRGSKLIGWATRGYSHISIRIIQPSVAIRNEVSRRYDIRLTEDHEIESIQGKGVHHQPFVESDNQAWFDFDHTEAQAVGILLTLCGLVGAKYDWRGIGGFVLRRANWHNLKRWFCSELAAHALKKNGITLMNMPSHWIQPNICVSTPVCRRVRKAVSRCE